MTRFVLCAPPSLSAAHLMPVLRRTLVFLLFGNGDLRIKLLNCFYFYDTIEYDTSFSHSLNSVIIHHWKVLDVLLFVQHIRISSDSNCHLPIEWTNGLFFVPSPLQRFNVNHLCNDTKCGLGWWSRPVGTGLRLYFSLDETKIIDQNRRGEYENWIIRIPFLVKKSIDKLISIDVSAIPDKEIKLKTNLHYIIFRNEIWVNRRWMLEKWLRLRSSLNPYEIRWWFVRIEW